MDNELVAHTKEELNNLIEILLSNDKVVRVEKTISQYNYLVKNYLVAWDDPEEADE